MSNTIEGFGERTRNLVGCVTTTEMYLPILNTLAHEVEPNVDVFGSFIDGSVAGKIFCCIVVNLDLHGPMSIAGTQTGTESRKPYCFSGCHTT